MTSSYPQFILERESDNATLKRLLPNLRQQISNCLPPVNVRYKQYSDLQYSQLVKRVNHKALRACGLQAAIPAEQFEHVVAQLIAENPRGFPEFENCKGNFESSHYECDLFSGDVSQGWLAPRALNAALVQANTLNMTVQNGKFIARVKVFNQRLHLGHYYHKDVAERVYLIAKQLVLAMVAEHYRDHIPERVFHELACYVG